MAATATQLAAANKYPDPQDRQPVAFRISTVALLHTPRPARHCLDPDDHILPKTSANRETPRVVYAPMLVIVVPPENMGARRGVLAGGRRWWLLASVIGVATVAWLGLPRLRAWQMRSEARDALGALAQCLHGAQNEQAPDRLRRTLIAVSSQASGRSDWPLRCDRYALRLQIAVGSLERDHRSRCAGSECCTADESCQALARLRTALDLARTCLQAGNADDASLEQLLPLARSADLEPSEASSVAPPPQPARLHHPARMRPLSSSSAELLTDPPGSTPLRLLLHDQRGRHDLCSLDLSSASRAICRPLRIRPAGAGMGQLLAGEPNAPTLLIAPGPAAGGERWPHEVFDVATGRRLGTVPDRPRGGFAWRDGTAAILSSGPERDAATLHWIDDCPPRPPATIPTPSHREGTLSGPHLLFDELIWTLTDDGGDHRLLALRLDPGMSSLPPPSVVGSAGALGEDITVEPCRTGEVLAVLLRGRPHGYSTEVALAFRLADGWRSPVRATVPSDWFGLTCHGKTASLSWIDAQHEQRVDSSSPPGSAVEGTYRVHRVRCSSDGCAHQHTDVHLLRHSRASRYVVGDLGQAVMVLWRSPLGDVRARVAPLEELTQARDTPLFDDEAHQGFAWELGRGAVFARDRTAVIIVKAPRGGQYALYGLRIDDSGHAAPVEVEYAGEQGPTKR